MFCIYFGTGFFKLFAFVVEFSVNNMSTFFVNLLKLKLNRQYKIIRTLQKLLVYIISYNTLFPVVI